MTLAEFYRDKRVLITGHTGFKGCWLTTMLCEWGANVCGYALDPGTDPNMYDLLKLEKRKDIKFQSHIGDVRDYQHLFTVMQNFKPEIVFHLSAQPLVLTGYQQPRETYEINVMGTVNLLECMRQIGDVKSFVNVTTDKVYLERNDEEAYRENDMLCGRDPYSNSKSCSELVTYAYQHSFFDVPVEIDQLAISTCRAGNVLGGGDWQKHRIIPDLIRGVINHEPTVIRHPESVRPFQFVLEPLYLYVLIAMEQYINPKYAGSYNIGPDIENCASVQTIINYFQKYEPAVQYTCPGNVETAQESARLVINNTKIKQVFNYRPVYDLETTIKLVCEWYQAWMKGQDMYAFTLQQIKQFLDHVEWRKN